MSTFPTLAAHRHAADATLCDVSAAKGATAKLPHVVIVGAGFGGLSAAKALAHAPVCVTLIDRRNHHLFQPLLYQVATAALSPADIASPIRTIVRDQRNTTVLLGEVTGVDTAGREILLGDYRVPYDHLVLATGATHSYFGHDEWQAFAPGLKSLDDATVIRRRVLVAFERAEAECSIDEQRRLLTFVVVGGGPTGVEMAGAIAEIAHHALASDYRNVDPRSARVILIEAGPRLLPAFPEPLSANAKRRLERLGVEVRIGAAVTACDSDGVMSGADRIEARTIIWGAGVAASPAARWLGVEADRAGRVIVEPDLTVPGLPDVFVIGDTAHVRDKDGKALPGVAPVAKQQGSYVARVIASRATDRAAPGAFAYRNAGNLATIGRKAAIADFGGIRLTGFVAWALWSIAHVYFLIGFRNRLAVATNWLWAYLTFERGARLITGAPPSSPAEEQGSVRRLKAVGER